MKYFLLSLLLFPGWRLPAQPVDSSLIPLAPTEQAKCFALLHREQDSLPFLFKWNALSLAPLGSKSLQYHTLPGEITYPQYVNFSVELEQHITPWLAVQGSISLIAGAVSAVNLTYDDLPEKTNWSRLMIEPRVYLDNLEMVDNTTPAGFYASFAYARAQTFGPNIDVYNGPLPQKEWSLAMHVGLQRRLHHWGYFDFGYGAGRRVWMEPDGAIPLFKQRRSWFLAPRFSLGITVRTAPRDARELRQQWQLRAPLYAKRAMWRIGLSGVFNLPEMSRVSGYVPLEYERQLFHSAGSIVAAGTFRYALQNPESHPFWEKGKAIRQFDFGLASEFRYYLNRIFSKNPGNRLQGIYGGIRAAWSREFYDNPNIFYPWERGHARYWMKRFFWGPVAGWQMHVSENLFIGYQAGFGRIQLQGTQQQGWFVNTLKDWYLYSRIGIGVAL